MLWRKDICSILRFLVEKVTRDCVLEKKLIGLVEDFVVKDTVDCCRRFVESFVEIFCGFQGDFDCQKDEFSGGFECVAIAVLAEDIYYFYLPSLLYLGLTPCLSRSGFWRVSVCLV